MRRQGRVLVLTLDDPATRNALHPSVYIAGLAALQDADADPEMGAVVLTGAGGTFCSGGNIARLRARREQPPAVQRESIEHLHAFIRALRRSPLPVVAAVEGSAAGAGWSLVLAADLVVAAREARFSMAYVKVGLNPDGGASAFLARALPPPLAAEMLFEGAPVAAERLHALGLVNRLTEPGGAYTDALAWAERLADGPRAALGRAKRLLESALRHNLDTQLDLEAELLTEAVHHPEAGEGLTAFLEKRRPQWRPR
ncbi:enoyl-CoA hydratase [Caenispirillum bisanense]